MGRAKHNGHWIPAKVVHSRGVAYVPYGGKEHVKDAFQVKHYNIHYLYQLPIQFFLNSKNNDDNFNFH